MRIAGFSRTGRREPLPAAIICVLLFVGPAFSLIYDLAMHRPASPTGVLSVLVGAVFLYVAVRWFWLAFMSNVALEVTNGRLRVNMLLSRSVRVADILGVAWGEVVSKRSRSYRTIRVNVRSGEPLDIPVVIFDAHPDEIMQRLSSLRSIW